MTKPGVSHVQVLRAKQPTLIFNAHEPRYPGPPPLESDYGVTRLAKSEFKKDLEVWQSRAQAFARFYSICFLPLDGFYGAPLGLSSPDFAAFLSWDNFCRRIQKMEESERLIDHLRLEAMFAHVYGFRSNSRKDILMSNFRHRKTTIWNASEKREAASVFALHSQSKFRNSNSSEALSSLSTTVPVKPSQIKKARSDAQFVRSQNATMTDIFGDPTSLPTTTGLAPVTITTIKPPSDDVDDDDDDNPPSPTAPTAEPSVLNLKNIMDVTSNAEDLRAKAKEMSKHVLDPDPPQPVPKARKRKRLGGFVSLEQEGRSYLDTRDLTKSQTFAIEKIFRYFCEVSKLQTTLNSTAVTADIIKKNGIEPPRILLTGDPGSGKSYFSETVTELAARMRLGAVLATSYNGIAAVNVDGNTICSMFSIIDTKDSPDVRSKNDDWVQQKKVALSFDQVCFIIVDEVSTIDSKVIALLDLRLRQLSGVDAPFGGMPIILAGDFNQLGPVMKTFLPRDMMTYAKRLHLTKRVNNPIPPPILVMGRRRSRRRSPRNSRRHPPLKLPKTLPTRERRLSKKHYGLSHLPWLIGAATCSLISQDFTWQNKSDHPRTRNTPNLSNTSPMATQYRFLK